MPASRKKRKHTSTTPSAHHTDASVPKFRRSVALVISILSAVFGLLAVLMTRGTDVPWMVAGTLAGAIIGYLVGHAIDKSIANK